MDDTPNPPTPSNPAPVPAPTPTPGPNENQIRQWHMWCHMSALAGLAVPSFGNALGPLIIWQIKKNEIPSVDAHGKAALNFQITVLLASLVAIPVSLALTFFCCLGIFLVVVAGVIPLAGVIMGIIAGVKANEGKEFRYPFSIPFIR